MGRHLSIFTDTHWTLIGFVIFVVLFVAFIASTYIKSQIEIHKHLSQLPLEEDKKASST